MGTLTPDDFEKKVVQSIKDTLSKSKLEAKLGEILVPTHEVTEVKKGKRTKKERKYFPGYVLIKVELTNQIYHLIKNLQKVSGFLGSGDKPTPISDQEIQRILGSVTESAINQKSGISFEIGEKVKVCDGPFASFNGSAVTGKDDNHISPGFHLSFEKVPGAENLSSFATLAFA